MLAGVLGKMNILTTIGTRPEAIRLFHTIKEINPVILWTGQNFSKNLSEDILEDPRFGNTFKTRLNFDTKGATKFSIQFSKILKNVYNHLEMLQPEKLLILGDTNSALASALAAKKLGIPVYHMEAGNRCYDPSSPEESNRRMIDSIADVHMCYTSFARQNLLSEGVPLNRIHVIGNPMAEFPELHEDTDQGDYILVTIHRQENEKYLENLKLLFKRLARSAMPVKLVLHPRYYNQFDKVSYDVSPSTNFSDFIKLQKRARLIITDSGTVCEEAAMLRKPCLIARRTTERPELLELGSTILADMQDPKKMLDSCFELIYGITNWELPTEYKFQRVSSKVKNILYGTGNYV